jgi:hypothetical protein
MKQDPIVEEVRRVREAHAAQFEFNLLAIYDDLKKQEENSQHEKVSFAPKRIQFVRVKRRRTSAA